jgi:ElaB/YqjD/DUF883 family membrane-anchored ribosome-binding protein
MAQENQFNQGTEATPQVGNISETNALQETGSRTSDTAASMETISTQAPRGGEEQSAQGGTTEQNPGEAGQVLENAGERARTFKENADQYVRENPLKAVFSALGVGFVLGLVMRR